METRREEPCPARDWEELDRRLDEALECTFPASDPFSLPSIPSVTVELEGRKTTPRHGEKP